MSNAEFWDKKRGHAVSPTVCRYEDLKPYHPHTFADNKYIAAINRTDTTDVFILDLAGATGWDLTAVEHASKLEFGPGNSSYEFLIAVPKVKLAFSGNVLKSWRIDFEKIDGDLIFIDTLTWVNDDPAREEKITSWRWKQN